MRNIIIPLTIVSILADGKFYSNEYLRKYLNINYVDIKKHIQTLQGWGVSLFTKFEEGYSLLQPIQLLDEKFICNQIKTNNVKILPVVNSTSQYLIRHLAELSSGDICIAECQYAARGRREHKWFSPFGVNLYFSMYWCLKLNFMSTIGLSLMISIVVAEVLQKLSTNPIRIKWPNDLYIKNRKLAGILVEIVNNTGGVLQTVIGIGINIAMRNVQNGVINQNWISLYEVSGNINRSVLMVQLVKKLCTSLIYFEKEGLTPFLSKWEQLDNFINCQIKLVTNNKIIYGISRGVDMHGALLLEQDGIIKKWIDGEIF